MTSLYIVEIIAAVTMVTGILGILVTRRNKGIGIRVIQFSAVVLVLPIILILAIEKLISTDVVGTLLGAIVGYVLSGIATESKADS